MNLLSTSRSLATAALPLSFRRRVRYRRRFGRPLSLRRPQRFSEKVTWRIVYDRRPLLRGTCDKLQMQQHALRTAPGSVRVPRTHWHGTDVAELAQVDLPERWVLKPNHRSGLVLFGEGPADVAALREQTRGWTDDAHWRITREWAYADASPELVVEEFIGSGAPPADYKVFVFDGEPRMVQVHTSRFGEHLTRQYTADWEPLPWNAGHPAGADEPRPERLEDMLEAASSMGAGFDMLRVDFYLVDGELWFGEITPYPGSGLVVLDPALDELMGSWWTLPSRAAVRG